MSCNGRGMRISIVVQIRGKESRVIIITAKESTLYRIPFLHKRIIEINHLHGDTIPVTVYGPDRCQRLRLLYDGKIEVIRL